MSWLLKSFHSDGPDSSTTSPDHSPTNLKAGVKEDLSVLGETIGRQLRGVASFLAPPPSSPPSVTAFERREQEEERNQEQGQAQQSDKLVGIRNDLAEIGGSFKTGLSLLSSNTAVSEISKFASSFLQFPNQGDHDNRHEEDEDDEDDGVPGITEEVVEFVKEISKRPEFWTDFPLLLNTGFKMLEVQWEHAENIEHLVPSFEALKVKLQHQMADEIFWMIYFILLLPRLDDRDFVLLSSPKVIETRDTLLQKLQSNKNAQVGNSGVGASEVSSEVTQRNQEIFSEENVREIVNSDEELKITSELKGDQWLEEADIRSRSPVNGDKILENEEDVSFSDLEDDDDLSNRAKTSPTGSSDWVQLNERPATRGGLQKVGQSISRDKDAEGEESNDWLTDDDFVNVASGKRISDSP